MKKPLLLLSLLWISALSAAQTSTADKYFTGKGFGSASISVSIANVRTGEWIMQANPEKSLIPASILKIVTSSAALELLGPEYTFRTQLLYSGNIDQQTGRLEGNIIIKGGGDPALGSDYFSAHYGDFMGQWIEAIRKLGITGISGGVIADDSYFDHRPLPGGWLWEDTGNYYGAGVYGLTINDNTCYIHLDTKSDSGRVVIKSISPAECRLDLENYLKAAGNTDEGYIFLAPYSAKGWVEGEVPPGRDDFVIKGSMPDPPLTAAAILTNRLALAGINTSVLPSTARTDTTTPALIIKPVFITETISPSLNQIIRVLNHESVNLYAEHLLRELGKQNNGSGSSTEGIKIIMDFLEKTGTGINGVFLKDGSGLSPMNAINTAFMTRLLIYMSEKARFSVAFHESLPRGGKNGTVKNSFREKEFVNGIEVKSGSMTRVKNYAGYITTNKGNLLAFCVIVNNFSGPSSMVTKAVENLLKSVITTE